MVMPESIIVRGPDGTESTVTAQVLRFSPASRWGRATAFALGGLIGGTACIIIPIVHLFTTWALPLLGFFMAWRTLKRDVVVLPPDGPCPACRQPLQLTGGVQSDPEWQVCPLCKATLQFDVGAGSDAVGR
jgi:hypothetical protein